MKNRSLAHRCQLRTARHGRQPSCLRRPGCRACRPSSSARASRRRIDGWFFNPDGSQTFLVGYFNRNTEQEVDIPIGPNNHFEPGEADLGQPTHFLTRRRYGMFVVPIPKSFGKTDQLWWSLTFNGVTNKIPMHTKAEYTGVAVHVDRKKPGRRPQHTAGSPVRGARDVVPGAGDDVRERRSRARRPSARRCRSRCLPTTMRSTPPGANGPMNNPAPPVNVTISKYRGPGRSPSPTRGRSSGNQGRQGDGALHRPSRRRPSPSASRAEYVVHVTANDYSGNGGGGSVCCWTNALLKVAVSGARLARC